MKTEETSTKYTVGDLAVIWITGCVPNYVARVEVVDADGNPTRFRVLNPTTRKEDPTWPVLKPGDFILRHRITTEELDADALDAETEEPA